jgi:hypothetical protein
VDVHVLYLDSDPVPHLDGRKSGCRWRPRDSVGKRRSQGYVWRRGHGFVSKSTTEKLTPELVCTIGKD